MSDVAFKPSEIYPFFPNSILQKGEKEAIAAVLVSFLASNGNEWKEVEWTEFMQYACTGTPPIHPVMLGMFKGPFARSTLVQVKVMVIEEYLVYRLDETTKTEYLKAGDKLVAFYAGYVRKPVA